MALAEPAFADHVDMHAGQSLHVFGESDEVEQGATPECMRPRVRACTRWSGYDAVIAAPDVGSPLAGYRTRVLNVEESAVRGWFTEYLSAFAALGRGERRPGDVVPYYGVPLLVTTDDVIVSLGTANEVATWLQSQADAMLATDYDHTETLASAVAILNHNTAVHRAEFSRERADDTEINRMAVTYVITRDSEGFRISTLVLHSP